MPDKPPVDVPPARGNVRWTPRSAFRHAVEVTRDEGFRGLWPRILGETVYRRLVLLERRLDEEQPLVDAAIEVTYGFTRDVDELSRFRDWPARTEILRRLDRGERCYAARQKSRLAAIRWVATGSVLIPYLARTLDLADGDVFVYEAYTAPELRRRGLARAIESRLGRALRAEGHRRVLRTVLPENRSGVGMHTALGNRPIGRVGYVKAGPWRHDFLCVRSGRLPDERRPARPVGR